VLDSIFGIDEKYERSIAGWSDLIHPADRQHMTDYFSNEVTGKHLRFDKEYRIVRKNDGAERWVHGLGELKFDAQDQLTRMLGSIQDITERKNAEEALRESEEKFKYVFDNSVVGKSITLPSGEINVNKAFCEMLGYSREELTSRKWQEISHPDDIELTQTLVNSLLSGEKESARFTKRYLHKNGTVVWTDVGTAIRRDKDGKPLYFMTTISDITERKQMEDELHANALLLDQAYDAIMVRNMRSEIVFWNKGAERTYGWIKNEALGRVTHTLLNTTFPESREAVDQSLLSEGIWEGELIHTRIDGAQIVILSRQVLQRNDQGQAIGILEIDRDITERKKMNDVIQASELRFRSVAKNLIDIVYEWDLKDKVDWYGDIDGMMGFPTGQFPRTLSGWADMVHPNDRSAVLAAVDAQLKHAIPYIVEYRVRKMDDTWRWWSARGTVLPDEHGHPYRWVGSITDITERKQAVDALQISERKYRQLHESMMDGFVSVNMNGKFLECNEIYRNMLGYSEAELAHLTYFDLTPEKWHEYETDH
jgi:PAS domain S-box-containing protein